MQNEAKNQEVGFVSEVKEFIAQVDGLPSARINDLVESTTGAIGMVVSLHTKTVEVLLLNDVTTSVGDVFHRSSKQLAIPVSQNLLGRAITPLGTPIDGKGPIPTQGQPVPIDQEARGIHTRQFIKEQFLTGVTMVDMLIPLGKGQRELVIGDARSGKTTFLQTILMNQKYTNTICIYASIGKGAPDVRKLLDIIGEMDALSNTIVIAASSSDPAPLVYIAPKAAMTIAEYFQKQGRDVLVILDDLGIHAKIYREIALLGGKAPGRESYPGDVFYQHAHLLERAGNFNKEAGGGSITALPVIELNLTDFTSFIPTNLMSMTDGHLLFTSVIYNQGRRPAIDSSLSVSRVGRQTQKLLQNTLSSKIRVLLAQVSQFETISSFSTELPAETQRMLKQKEFINEILNQDVLTHLPLELQTVLMALVFSTFLAEKEKSYLARVKRKLIMALQSDPSLQTIVKEGTQLDSADKLIAFLSSHEQEFERVCQDNPGGSR